MILILTVVTFQGFLYQMATAQYTILPIQNQPVSNLNRQQLIHALLTTFDQPTTPQRLELLASAVQEIPPKKNRIVLAELLKQTALQTLKVAASVCNAAEFAENFIRLPQNQFKSGGYVLPNYVPEVLTTSKRVFNYVPDVLNNYVPRKEVLTNFVPRKEVVNYVPEVLGNFVPRKEVVNYMPGILGNFVPRKEVVNYVPEVLGNFVPRKEIVNYVSDILGNVVPRKEVVTNYVPKKDVYNDFSNLLANNVPYF